MTASPARCKAASLLARWVRRLVYRFRSKRHSVGRASLPFRNRPRSKSRRTRRNRSKSTHVHQERFPPSARPHHNPQKLEAPAPWWFASDASARARGDGGGGGRDGVVSPYTALRVPVRPVTVKLALAAHTLTLHSRDRGRFCRHDELTLTRVRDRKARTRRVGANRTLPP